MKVRVRIAPSPTGYPHIGTIWQALVNFAFAKKHQGKFIIRIEDTDKKRLIPDAEEKLFKALAWFNFVPDESPIHDGKYGPYRQSERLDLYKKYAQILVDKNKAYYCFCSQERIDKVRKKMQRNGQPPMYDGYCRRINLQEAKKRIKAGEKYVIRLKVPKNKTIIVNDLLRGSIKFDSNVVDDQVLIKSDGYPTYQLAVVVDDYLMKISHMVRGEEWISSAPKVVLIYDFLGWKKPVFVHTSLLRNPDKSKLSKRQAHTNVSWYQEKGYLPEAILNFLSLLGWSHPQGKTIFSLKEFIKYFDFKDLSAVGPVVDLKKLDYINGVYIRSLSDEKLLQLIKPYIKSSKLKTQSSKLMKIITLVKERMVKLKEVNDLLKFFFEKPKYKKNLFKGKRIKEELTEVIKGLNSLKEWQPKKIYETIKNICIQGEYHKKEFYVNLYIAIQGKESGLPLFESMEILGKKESLKRLKQNLRNLRD